MAKLTPPSPQHSQRRTRFFQDHPDQPGAEEHFRQINVDIITQAHNEFVAQKRTIKDGKALLPKFTLEQIAEKIWGRFYKTSKHGGK